ncbi:MAG: DUF177 domain-containing protein [Defluviitaleaceae bacterium]|nr:DUF177 domain-containing protein [Defluviitaleaceae bacterium]
MLVNLKEVKANKPLRLSEELKLLGHIVSLEGSIQLFNEDTYELKAKASIKANLICDYCLKDVSHSENFSIDEPLELQGEDLEKFTLEPILAALIHEHLPMQVLCKEDCLGFCKDCGVNLNLESCICSKSNEDSPFSKLLELDFKEV